MDNPHKLLLPDPLASRNSGESTTLEGVVDRIVYSNLENGYTVARFHLKGKPDPITIVGNLVDVHPGEGLRVTGRWTTHRLYGEQLQVESYLSLVPATVHGIEKYLGSGLIKGIGPVMARRLVQRFGMDTLRIIEEEGERLQEVEGIGKERAHGIRETWLAQKGIREMMIFLQGHGVSAAYAARIYQQYGSQAAAVVRENPYRLATEVFGIGFKMADKIAQNLGVDPQSPLRAQAGVFYLLKELSADGHVCYPREGNAGSEKGLIEKGEEILGLGAGVIAEAVATLQETGRLVVEEQGSGGTEGRRSGGAEEASSLHPCAPTPLVYLPEYFRAEVEVASRFRALAHAPLDERLKEINLERLLTWLDKQQRIRLADNQRQAIIQALHHKVLVITGGPGTGKTTTVNSLLRVFEGLGWKMLLCAPTGRAAKRLAEAAQRPAKTIHRLLEFSFQKGGFQRDEDRPLEAEAIVVDEVSMMDLSLMEHLLRAIPSKASLILVGDVNQLPSVGPGNVLRDIIASGMVQTVGLTEIFRQARQSLIVTNAHRINEGIYPILPEWNGEKEGRRDLYYIAEEDPGRVLDQVKELCVHWIPREFGFHPSRDIQVLSPMNKGIVGTINLNAELQKVLNPHEQDLVRGGRTFRVGDKVMQIHNDYQKDIFNGDIGWITRIDPEEQQVAVEYDTGMVSYDYGELDEIVPAYCVSIHKGQGSEYPAIVLPLLTQHYILLQRNLLYTALTRARKLAVLIGSKKAIAMAVRNDKVRQRYTRLRERLMGL